MQKSKLFIAATITLFAFPLVAFLVSNFSRSFNYYEIFPERVSIFNLAIGLGFGIIVSAVAVAILRLKKFKDLTHNYQVLFKGIDVTWVDIIFYSICAGVGEEIFFRGMLLEFIGIWPAAILFVALHGYISFKSTPKLIYAAYLIIVSAGFGYLYVYTDIYAAMLAHAFYDVIMFWLLLKPKSRI
ncbi:CPBP family intramembrane glutamic endopeptidase [Psychroflexus sp. ALD_RP9]|uniref:CPBP family intramembrane glutamic endopeptidase n=1 Tax=Psychroflexus sp. ALD_RP9 TaxID=2777186 RepID=UPI001A8E4A97|nr:type II CAAX endopeptidase family protein [Psychroflexus sp. ALD_RP9]QSS96235.1 CPBP family intramembrane metalloprotease [Psychroflexus sp. ALD_RP9]